MDIRAFAFEPKGVVRNYPVCDTWRGGRVFCKATSGLENPALSACYLTIINLTFAINSGKILEREREREM